MCVEWDIIRTILLLSNNKMLKTNSLKGKLIFYRSLFLYKNKAI